MRNRDRRDWWVRAASWALTGVLVAFIGFSLIWRVEGGRWEHVETPSMGTVAPVGTLLWIKPADFDHLEPGDFITFHPPGEPGVTYSHRVFKRYADGTISTKGVIPAPDPWRLHSGDVVGKVAMAWWGAGWLIVAAPVLIVGGLITGAIRSVLKRRWRLPATIVLASLVVTVAITWYRPFVNAQQLAFVPAHHGAEATYVGTGLLPIRVSASQPANAAASDGSVVLGDGHVGTVHVTEKNADGRWAVDLHPAIPLWWWIVLVLLCFLPALYSLLIGLPPPRRDKWAQTATA